MCLFATLLSGNCLLTCLHCCSRLPLMKSRCSSKGLRSVGSKHCHQGRLTVFPLSHLPSDKKEEMFDFCLCSLLLKEPRSFFDERNCVCVCVCIYVCLCLRELWTQSAQSSAKVTLPMNLKPNVFCIRFLKKLLGGNHTSYPNNSFLPFVSLIVFFFLTNFCLCWLFVFVCALLFRWFNNRKRNALRN